MKRTFTYLFGIVLLSGVFINCSGQDYYQPAGPKNINQASGKIIIYPNPVVANSYFDLEIDSSSNNYPVTLLIFNSSGFVKDEKVLKLQKGNNSFEINLSGYGQGNYVVRIVADKPQLFSYATQLVVR